VADVPRLRVEAAHVEVLFLERAKALLDYVANFKDGKYVWYFALALFGGIRPGGELEKLAGHQELLDFKNRVIRLSGAISKTGKARQIKLRPNLYEWLFRYPAEIFPINADRELKAIRKRFGLSHDVLRHTFCSAHVMAFGSFAETALESGNSESIIRNFYLNTMAQDEARAFWAIVPEEALEGKVVRLA
jgi:integrase